MLQEIKEQIFKLPSNDRLALVSAIINSLQNQPVLEVDRSDAIRRMRGLLKTDQDTKHAPCLLSESTKVQLCISR
ncbi:hypothetical protein [Pseudanabaena mucicola]|uniref:Uncharacterized protein n=1 Tax=Pseudanabaena mucicola FACHB-723 TaxID=2692860 RepID=A0ABR8A046_9CYAN|nr:hypothetical protein [Pseudanabaena mucicola]MBD2189606.1 hypothetical protein [Pseudanabaena mucicola FACHB-723]